MMERSHHESEAQVPTTPVARQERVAAGVSVSVVDEETMARVDRYRAAFERAHAGPEETYAEPFENVVDRVLLHLASFGRLAWAVEHPLDPRSVFILLNAEQENREELQDLFAELRRFGLAIEVKNDPAKLARVEKRGEIERRETKALRDGAAKLATSTELEVALYWVRVLETRLQMLNRRERAAVLAQLSVRRQRKRSRH